MGAILYLVGKFLAYSGWMFVGLRQIPNQRSPLLRSALLGLLRLCLGFFFGVLIYLASSALLSLAGYGLGQNVLAYLLVYAPVRWIEWGIMSLFLFSGGGRSFLLGRGKADRWWRTGGIVISCLADIPLIVSLGGVIPTGRFLC